jgi:hypothetical protein
MAWWGLDSGLNDRIDRMEGSHIEPLRAAWPPAPLEQLENRHCIDLTTMQRHPAKLVAGAAAPLTYCAMEHTHGIRW